MEEKITAIYYIKDLRTDKIIYIGQTINYKKRKADHFCSIKQPIDKYMFEEGKENFIMEKFDIDCTNMTEEERKQREDELILQYDTINNGFNMIRSGLISKNLIQYNKEYRQDPDYKRRHKQNQKDLYQTYKGKNYYKEYYKKNKEYIKNRCREYYKKKQEKLANETS